MNKINRGIIIGVIVVDILRGGLFVALGQYLVAWFHIELLLALWLILTLDRRIGRYRQKVAHFEQGIENMVQRLAKKVRRDDGLR